jgi:hypothetical protein
MNDNIRENYSYEVELENGEIYTNTDNYDKNIIVRISFIPQLLLFPRHDLIFTNFKFERRFCRITMGIASVVQECIHCVVTDSFRFYLRSSNGQVLITEKDYELYI